MHNQVIVTVSLSGKTISGSAAPGHTPVMAGQTSSHHPMFGIDLSAKTKRNVAEFHYFYNFESAVGQRQENHRPSVLLAQYMLSLFLKRYGSQLGMEANLEVTGTMDEPTDRAIRAFQEWLAWSPHAGNVPVDGVLAPVNGLHVPGPAGPYVPPVLLLNRLWACIEPETFTNPSLLSAVIGEEAASTLWASHPLRQSA